MTDPERWLADRLADAPASLREPIDQALAGGWPGGTAADFAAWLRAAGDRLLADAQQDGTTRDSALTLLAADALVTLAVEWIAETDPARLASLE